MSCKMSAKCAVIVISASFLISVPNSWFEVNQMYHISARVIIVHQNSSSVQQTIHHRLVIISVPFSKVYYPYIYSLKTLSKLTVWISCSRVSSCSVNSTEDFKRLEHFENVGVISIYVDAAVTGDTLWAILALWTWLDPGFRHFCIDYGSLVWRITGLEVWAC